MFKPRNFAELCMALQTQVRCQIDAYEGVVKDIGFVGPRHYRVQLVKVVEIGTNTADGFMTLDFYDKAF